MSGTKISAAADAGTLLTTDVLPVARSGSTTAYHATMAEVASYANGAYAPNYYTGTPAMDGTGASGTAAFVSRGDHVHPSDISRAPLASPTFTGVPAAPTPTTGTNTTQLATTAFVQSQMVASGAGVSTWNTRAGAVVLQQADIVAVGALHDVGRNLLHNPLFNVAQRGAGPFSSGTGYTLDRWCLSSSLDTNVVTQVAANDAIRAVIGDEAARLLLQFGVTGNAGAGAYSQIYHRIEDLMRLSGKTVTVSFFANTTAALKLGLSVDQNFGTGGSPSTSVFGNGQAVTLATTFARYSLTFTLPSAAGKTLGSNGDHNTQLCLWLSSGTAQATRAGNIGVQSGTINLWGMQLEVGSVATPLEKPDPRYDLSNCRRFYQTGFADIEGYNTAGAGIGYFYALSAMRAAPTVALFSQGYINASGASASSITPGGFVFKGVVTAAGAAVANSGWNASADL